MLSGPTLPPQRGGPPGTLVVLLHGLGADGSDLIGLAPTLARALPDALFAAPDAPAPCDMAPYGRQWFSLQERRPETLLAGAATAEPLLQSYIDMLLQRYGLDDSRLALIGFSQGTMMALHAAPRRPRAAAAVVGFSGALIGAERLAAEVRSTPPVLLIHGDRDEVVPVGALFDAVAGLQKAAIPVVWEIRRGLGHGIDPEGLELARQFLVSRLGRPG